MCTSFLRRASRTPWCADRAPYERSRWTTGENPRLNRCAIPGLQGDIVLCQSCNLNPSFVALACKIWFAAAKISPINPGRTAIPHTLWGKKTKQIILIALKFSSHQVVNIYSQRACLFTQIVLAAAKTDFKHAKPAYTAGVSKQVRQVSETVEFETAYERQLMDKNINNWYRLFHRGAPSSVHKRVHIRVLIPCHLDLINQSNKLDSWTLLFAITNH